MLPRRPRGPSVGGDLVDDFLFSFGYNLDAVCTIADAYDQSSSAEEFSLILAPLGFVVAEALFLHRLIKRS